MLKNKIYLSFTKQSLLAMPLEIDREYFENYAGSQSGYQNSYREFSRAQECIELFERRNLPKPRSICVLGAATGEVLQDFKKGFATKNILGCEISRWAYQKIPSAYRRRIAWQDMREFIFQAKLDGTKFDLVFTNSLVYLNPDEIISMLQNLRSTTQFVHFHSSMRGACCSDPYRRTLRGYQWWATQFRIAGFESMFAESGNDRYLWG